MSGQKRPHSAESGYSSSDDHSKFLPVVQGMGRLSLVDDGVRDWQEQAIERLNNFYPDWKNLRSSYMVPASFPLTKSDDVGQLAEKHIFDLLENFGRKYNEPMFVVHSYNFKELCNSIRVGGSTANKWVIGEHDFVIIHKHYGVIFFQVKARNEENWQKALKEAQKQVDKDKVSLKISLQNLFSSTAKKRMKNFGFFKYPGFVLMPNCERPGKHSLSIADVLFKEDCNSLESFHSWWCDKVVRPHSKDDEDADIYEALVVRFVALYYFSPPLKETIDHNYRQIAKYHTPQQLEILMGAPSKQWFIGPAGSGKTVILIDKVLQLLQEVAGSDDRTLVLVFNRPLRDYLCQILKGDKIEVLTYMQFLYNKQIISRGQFSERNYSYNEKCDVVESSYIQLQSSPPSLEEKYEHIFVDEGQDLFNEHWPELLKLFHNKPDTDSRRKFYFWVMFDSNQYVQPGQKHLPLQDLENAFRLRLVLRNTRNVFDLSKKYFKAFHEQNEEIKLGHTEAGLNILWINKLREDKSNCVSLVDEQIRNLREKGVKDEEVAILTRTKPLSTKLSTELERDYMVKCQNAEDYIQSNQVIVESIRRFKGLESKVVIIVDPEYTVDQRFGNQASELMYVAVSRCLCYLIIISTGSGCDWLQSDAGLKFPPEILFHKESSPWQLQARFNDI